MTSEATSCALARDILEWHVPEEVLAVLLKDCSTGRNRHFGTYCRVMELEHWRAGRVQGDNGKWRWTWLTENGKAQRTRQARPSRRSRSLIAGKGTLFACPCLYRFRPGNGLCRRQFGDGRSILESRTRNCRKAGRTWSGRIRRRVD